MPHDRKSFKSPPTSLTSTKASQALRRAQALEDQRRRREQRYDSSRQLDILSSLNLGPSDDEEDDNGEPPQIIRDGISQFASLLSLEAVPPSKTPSQQQPSSSQADNAFGAVAGGHVHVRQQDHQTNDVQQASPQPSTTRGKKKKKAKRRQKPQPPLTTAEIPQDPTTSKTPGKKRNQWADRCMYAELLELNPGAALNPQIDVEDGLPDDLDTGAWIAVSGVPVGKRCLAVTYASSGVAGTVPNTVLRSRLVGKHLLPAFPSILPQNTILDCILDQEWTQNGILHILDVIKWKGQDIGDCEASFRFWWRDTRMQELLATNPNTIPESAWIMAQPGGEGATTSPTAFPYPMTFAPIPYHSDVSLPNLLSTVIPMARSPRTIPMIPRRLLPSSVTEGEMEVDAHSIAGTEGEVQRIEVQVRSEGLLLYVSQATYEPGTSPLSTWVPTQFEGVAVLDLFERLVQRRSQMGISRVGANEVEMEI